MSDLAYAVKMEFTLQDNASKKLEGVANKFEDIEKIAAEVMSKLGKAYANAGEGAQKAFEEMTTSFKKAGKSLKMEDLVTGIVKFHEAVGDLDKVIKELELEQSKLTKETEDYNNILTKMSQANFHWDETEQLKEIAAIYTDFEKNKLPRLRIQYELNKKTNKKAAEADMKAIKEFEGLKKKYQRDVSRSQKGREYDKKRNKYPNRKKWLLEYNRKKRKKRITAYRAYDALHWAIRTGKLLRKPCEMCGDTKSQGHHEDYTKPLDVVWLCQRHHMERHEQYKRKY
jgi:uncharacterized OB-fold protein